MNWMQTYLLKRIFLVALLLCVGFSCTKFSDDMGGGGKDDPVMLRFSVSVPQPRASRLGDETDDLAPKNAWEAVVDGQVMYRLTLLLVRKDIDGKKYLVGYRDISYSPSKKDVYNPTNNVYDGFEAPVSGVGSVTYGYPTRAHFMFRHSEIPAGHGASEKLTEGLYDVVAVANWSNTTIDGKTYGGLTQLNTTFTNLKAKLQNEAKGLLVGNPAKDPNADPDVYNLFFNKELVTGVDGVCTASPMPMTFMKIDQSVQPGANEISAELIRCRARVRIELTNLSENHYVNLSLLKFGMMGQKDAYLFEKDPTNPSKEYTEAERVAIDVKSPDALTPFIVNDPMNVNDVKHLPGLKILKPGESNSMVVFDGYILESMPGTLPNTNEKAEDIYKYEFALNHSAQPGIPKWEEKTFYRLDENPKPVPNAGSLTNGTYYVVHCVGASKIMGHEGNQYRFQQSLLTQTNVPATVYEPNFLWTKENTTLKTKEGNLYIRRDASLGTKDGGFQFYSNESSNVKVALWYETSWFSPDYYFRVPNNLVPVRVQNADYRNDDNLYFYFYVPRTEIKTIPVDYHKFPMRFINRENDNKVEQVRRIRRNDFVRIRLGVRYNDKNGNFDFSVVDWNNKQEDIEFN